MGTISFDNPPAHCVDPNSAEAIAAADAVAEEAKWNAIGKTKPVFPATTDEECEYILKLIEPKDHFTFMGAQVSSSTTS